MSTDTATKPPVGVRVRSWFGDNALKFYAVIAFAYLLLPVAYTFVFSFNDAGRTNIVWQGFTLDNWKNPCGAPQVCESVVNSIVLALGVTIMSTILGTLIAFALVRYQFRGRGTTNLTIFLPMATPEVVLGSSLLALFLNIFVPLGFWTVFIAHVMFCISFVVVTVKARLASLDPRLEQAAMDLYANEREAFRRITLPLVAPGIAAAALLAFSLSFDDFIITNFNSGQFTTFPKFVYVSATRGIPAQANVIASAMFFIALALVLVSQIRNMRRKEA
ncbi:MAG: ABC transporter permease [Candidatus Nanopelagicales bacterium]|jgi:spermidine/putrescine transport system permease protein|nr:ABC transporter permease [Candidatus Nanopelagicales bacterium]MCU0294516.1 ABC transporter permease [Candidatus Nanopelagicales bacterium]MCU0299172.1 ABC transporter permease [Candidatus Nanopelagicales bacterium]